MYAPGRRSSHSHPYSLPTLPTASKRSSIRIRTADSHKKDKFKLRMPRRQHITVWLVLGIIAFLSFWSILSFRHETGRSIDGFTPILQSELSLDDGVLKGEATAAKMENATLKAELGNAAWKVLHTTMAKFPDKPTEEDSQALKSYLHLFARLYPCGECARHFQKLLAKFPPQVTSRSSAAAWACHVHNQVNIRLKKEEFDCSKIGDFYDCGCADDEPVVKMDTFKQLELEKEGLTRGG